MQPDLGELVQPPGRLEALARGRAPRQALPPSGARHSTVYRAVPCTREGRPNKSWAVPRGHPIGKGPSNCVPSRGIPMGLHALRPPSYPRDDFGKAVGYFGREPTSGSVMTTPIDGRTFVPFLERLRCWPLASLCKNLNFCEGDMCPLTAFRWFKKHSLVRQPPSPAPPRASDCPTVSCVPVTCLTPGISPLISAQGDS